MNPGRPPGGPKEPQEGPVSTPGDTEKRHTSPRRAQEEPREASSREKASTREGPRKVKIKGVDRELAGFVRRLRSSAI